MCLARPIANSEANVERPNWSKLTVEQLLKISNRNFSARFEYIIPAFSKTELSLKSELETEGPSMVNKKITLVLLLSTLFIFEQIRETSAHDELEEILEDLR